MQVDMVIRIRWGKRRIEITIKIRL